MRAVSGGRTWRVLLPLVLIVAFFGLRGAGQDSLWYDEWWSVHYAGAVPGEAPIPFSGTLDRVSSTYHELNPPGFYLAINAWSRVTGDSPVTLRLFSTLVALLAVALVYRAGVVLDGPWAGVSASVLLATSAFFITYAHELRAYMSMVCLSAALITCYARIISTRFRSVPAMVYFAFWLSGTLLLVTHYMALPLAFALALYHVMFGPRNRRWWIVVVLALASTIGLLWWVPVALSALREASTDPARDYYARELPPLVERLLTRFSGGTLALSIVFGWYALRRNRLPWFLLIVGLLILGLINAVFRFVTDAHYLMAFLPPLALVLGCGAARAPGRGVLIGAWMLLGIGLTLSPPSTEAGAWRLYLPWQQMRTSLEQASAPGDVLLFALPPPDPNWIHLPVGAYYLHALGIDVRVLESLPDTTPETQAANVAALTDDALRLWVAADPTQPPSAFARLALDQRLMLNYLACSPALSTPDAELVLYARPEHTPGLVFGGASVDLLQPVESINPRRLLIETDATPEVPGDTYSVGVHVTDAAGVLVSALDYGLMPGRSCRLLMLPELPPGEYAVHALVYAWQTGERLTGEDASTGAAGDALLLARFRAEAGTANHAIMRAADGGGTP